MSTAERSCGPDAVKLDDAMARDLVRLFKLLSDETRLRILFALAEERELHVRGLCDRLVQSQPAVSHHLALLRDNGLIDRRREGKHNYYFVLPERFAHLLDNVFSGVSENGGPLRLAEFELTRAH